MTVSPHRMATLALCLGALTSAGHAQQSAPATTPPDWSATPPARDLAAFLPASLMRQNLNGRVMLRCRVTVQGRAADCAVLGEAPQGRGLGAAALRMAAVLRLKPATSGGQPTDDGAVQIPILILTSRKPPPDLAIPEDSTARRLEQLVVVGQMIR